MARKRKEVPDGWGINQCSLCETWRLTIGQQKHGGVRYCGDCIKETLAWVQLRDDGRKKLAAQFAEMAALPDVRAALAEVAPLNDPEFAKAHAIGESKRRLFEANIAEARGY